MLQATISTKITFLFWGDWICSVHFGEKEERVIQFNFAVLFFFLLGPTLLLMKRKITILFQALNFQTAAVSPGHILPPSAVDASIEAFCSFSLQPISGTKYYWKVQNQFPACYFSRQTDLCAFALSLQYMQELLPEHKELSSDTEHYSQREQQLLIHIL